MIWTQLFSLFFLLCDAFGFVFPCTVSFFSIIDIPTSPPTYYKSICVRVMCADENNYRTHPCCGSETDESRANPRVNKNASVSRLCNNIVCSLLPVYIQQASGLYMYKKYHGRRDGSIGYIGVYIHRKSLISHFFLLFLYNKNAVV